MSKSISTSTLILCSIIALVSQSVMAQELAEDDRQWFAASVVLDDAKMMSLRQTGFLKIQLPPQYINHVDTVLLKRPVFFKTEKATEFAHAEKHFNTVQIEVDESLLDHLDYQAVELRVYESDFNSIVLRYVAGIEVGMAKRKLSGNSQTDSPIVQVRLNNGKGIAGRIRGMRKLAIDSVMGEVKIKLEEASNISLSKDGLSFSMLNGDTLTGQVDLEEIELLTRWGNEVIDLGKIDSIQIQQSQSFINQQPMMNQPMMGQLPPMPMQQPMMQQPMMQPAPMMQSMEMQFLFPQGPASQGGLTGAVPQQMMPAQQTMPQSFHFPPAQTGAGWQNSQMPWSMQPYYGNPTMMEGF